MADSYRDLIVWQRAVALATSIYEKSSSFPKHEQFGLMQQLRRDVVSVGSNIAEGKGRGTKPDYVQFLYRARGSLFELDTQLEIALNLGYLSSEEHRQLSSEAGDVGRLLNGLISSIKRKIADDAQAGPPASEIVSLLQIERSCSSIANSEERIAKS